VRSRMLTNILAFALVMLVTAPALAAELRTGLNAGREARYAFTHELDISQQAGDREPARTNIRYRIELSMSVTSVNDDGSASVAMRFRKFQARIEEPSGPTSIAFDLSREQDDEATGVAAMGPVLANARLVVILGPDGRVRGIGGADPVLAAMNEITDAPPALFAFLRPDRLGEQINLLFCAEGGLGEHAEGASWNSTRSIPLGPAGAMELQSTTTLASATETTAELRGTTTVVIRTPDQPNAAAPNVSLGEATGTSTTMWDLRSGGLTKRTDEQTIESTWSLGDVSLKQRQESKNEIRLIEAD
jgi:hypothetical protein